MASTSKFSAAAEMSERLATKDMGQKVRGLLCTFLGDRETSEVEETAGHKH